MSKKSIDSHDSTSTSNCSRVIRQSKYEHNDPTTRLWWRKKFKELEDEVSIMPYEREDVIQYMFPEIEEKLRKILSFKQVSADIPSYAIRTQRTSLRRRTDVSDYIAAFKRYGSRESLMTDYNEFPAGGYIRDAPPNNPYRTFFKTRVDRAAIWRELPPIRLDEMDLTQKALTITENIAQKFYEWLISVGGEDSTTLDPPTIVKMFEIGFNYHAAKSLSIRIKEMPAVTNAIAMARSLPEASLRFNLHSHLRRDLKAFNTKEKQVAFGKMLPLELRSMPPKEDFAKKWFHCKRVPPELASMEAVWGGIEQLRSTKAFCGWLLDHPQIPPPPYLVEKGMMNKKFLIGPRSSIDDLGELPTEVSSKANIDN